MANADAPHRPSLRGRAKPFPTIRLDRRPNGDDEAMRIAWPVTAWRVIVPKPPQNESDPLARAVLRFIDAGYHDLEEIRRFLKLPADLIAYVRDVCISQQLVEVSGKTLRLTADGLKIAKHITDAAAYDSQREPVAGFVLRDAISGEVLPLFIEGSLPPTHRARADECRPLPFCPQFMGKPAPRDVLNAMRHFARIQSSLSDSLEDFDLDPCAQPSLSDEPPSDARPSGHVPDVTRVRVLSEKAEVLDLDAWLLIRPWNPADWHIMPPLDLRTSAWFKSVLHTAIRRHPRDLGFVDQWHRESRERLEEILWLSRSDDADDDLDALAMVPELEDVCEHLQQARSAEAAYESGKYHLGCGGAIVQYGVTVEALLRNLVEQIPHLPTFDRWIRPDYPTQIAQAARYFSVPLPRSWSKPSFRLKVIKAITGEDRQAKACASLLLIHAHRMDGKTPFGRALRQHTTLLEDVQRTMDSRHQYAHPGPKARNTQPNVILDQSRQAVHRVIEAVTSAMLKGDE